MVYVGLDISTSIIGFCALDESGNLLDIDHLVLKKEKSLYKKVDLFRAFIVKKTKNFSDIKFFVEAPLLMFKMKASMASVIALLQKFNALCCFQIYSIWNVEPILLNVASVRKTIGISLPKKKKKSEIKPIIFNHIKSLKIIPESHWTYKKTGTLKDHHYDECDACVVVKGGYILDKK
jgi:hypothetical protein